MVEPVDPLERGVLDVVDAPPRSAATDQLGLVEADDRLGERVVVAVATASRPRYRAGFGEALGVADRQVLAAPVGVVDEPVEVAACGTRSPSRGRPGRGRCAAIARPASPR